ncbi:MAG TPA: bifunctional oligoribonuclease/PAP phosphatase NrnA, partial [Bacillota bacterium]|nr:bifunctional oligoribonuclease/PAP phosphatase NrnA [Bacillota bacterium]
MNLGKVVSAINEAESIALIAHIMPDGDTLGSCLALYYSIKKLKNEVELFCTDSTPQNLNFLKDIGNFKNDEKMGKTYDLCIAVDCSDIYRLGTLRDLFEASARTISIDHHSSNTFFADINLVDADAAATGEIVYQLLILLPKGIDINIATALYTAITTDTGNFSFGNTSANTFRIAAELTEQGINIDEITTKLFRTKSIERIQLLARALSSLEMSEDKKIALLKVTQKDMIEIGAAQSDTENIINYAKEIEGVELAILLKETNKSNTKISLRTSENLDASEIASYFGGGGHKRAAGANIEDTLNKA